MQLEITKNLEAAFAGIAGICERLTPRGSANHTVITGALFNLSAEEAVAFHARQLEIRNNYCHDVLPLRHQVLKFHANEGAHLALGELRRIIPKAIGEVSAEEASFRRDRHALRTIPKGELKLLRLILLPNWQVRADIRRSDREEI